MRQALEEVRGAARASIIRLSIGGQEVDTGPRRLALAQPGPQLAGRGRDVAWPSAEHADRGGRRGPRGVSRPGRRPRPRSRRRPDPSGRDPAATPVRAGRVGESIECGKPWAEADGDVAEAIDFCEFYAREMIRLAEPRHRDVPGETNFTEHLPRGVAVVIPPWNFPLAIPTGMTVAALVAGNTVILKPAEQSPVMAWHLARFWSRPGCRRAC